jgi:glycosyltransferase involved in cell wall biosynthesis
MDMVTFAVCTFNRAELLPGLVHAMCSQSESEDFSYEVLIINNNSTDETATVLDTLKAIHEDKLRVVTETKQGISPARNRAVKESLGSQYLIFIDDDEIPCDEFLHAAWATFHQGEADCIGGKVLVRFPQDIRPKWFEDELLRFLAYTDYGDKPFWITDGKTPLWTANIGYRVQIFIDNPELRFDDRYSRVGNAVGGGEDVVMFAALLERNMRIRYCPGMSVEHFVEEEKVTRSYFIKRHYSSGYKQGCFETPDYENSILGVKPFMLIHFLRNAFKALGLYLMRKEGALRQVMTASHSFGRVCGVFARWRQQP